MNAAAGSPPRDPRDDNLIPFPCPAAPQMPATGTGLAPEVLDGELIGRPEFIRRPMPVVLPPWLRSWEIALGTLRWAVRYAGRHVGFHAWRAPAYGLALCWWPCVVLPGRSLPGSGG